MTSLKSQGKKVLLALGGWNDSAGNKYSKLVNSPENRNEYLNNILEFNFLSGMLGDKITDDKLKKTFDYKKEI